MDSIEKSIRTAQALQGSVYEEYLKNIDLSKCEKLDSSKPGFERYKDKATGFILEVAKEIDTSDPNYKEKLNEILPPSKSSSGGEWKKPKDTRIVYGANCVWWDSIDKVGSTSNHPRYPEDFQRGSGLPCCPHCGSVLFEVPSEEEWYREVEAFEKCDKNGIAHPGYRKFIEWQRGKCFLSMLEAAEKYKEETGIEVNVKF